MQTQNLGQKSMMVANIPQSPCVDIFAVREKSEMARLQREFNKVGLVHYSGRAHLLAVAPTPEQTKKLKAQGIDISCQKIFHCSPRKS